MFLLININELLCTLSRPARPELVDLDRHDRPLRQLDSQRQGSPGRQRHRHLAIGTVDLEHDRLALTGPGDGNAIGHALAQLWFSYV